MVALNRDDYQAAEVRWKSLKRLEIIGSREVEKMIEELAKMPLRNFVLRRINAYEKAAKSDDFDQAKNQLDPLRILARKLSGGRIKKRIGACSRGSRCSTS